MITQGKWDGFSLSFLLSCQTFSKNSLSHKEEGDHVSVNLFSVPWRKSIKCLSGLLKSDTPQCRGRALWQAVTPLFLANWECFIDIHSMSLQQNKFGRKNPFPIQMISSSCPWGQDVDAEARSEDHTFTLCQWKLKTGCTRTCIWVGVQCIC